jgi:hypothetical protein
MRHPVARTGVFLLTLFCLPLIAGLYGVLHDQFTYSISEEYYTRFKFIQFGFWHGDLPAQLTAPRIAVCAVGFLATWWTGIIIGPFIALTGLIHRDPRVMLRANFKAVLIVLLITAATGLTGLAYGWWFLSDGEVNWYLPEGLMDRKHFISVGAMHNFSYLGGLFGLIGGVIYQYVVKHSATRVKDVSRE